MIWSSYDKLFFLLSTICPTLGSCPFLVIGSTIRVHGILFVSSCSPCSKSRFVICWFIIVLWLQTRHLQYCFHLIAYHYSSTIYLTKLSIYALILSKYINVRCCQMPMILACLIAYCNYLVLKLRQHKYPSSCRQQKKGALNMVDGIIIGCSNLLGMRESKIILHRDSSHSFS